MVFLCQQDSFLETCTSKVVSCEPHIFVSSADNDKFKTIAGFNVILDDTVLFPEGGGQPCDHGHIDDLPVLDVRRHYADAVHFVRSDKPLCVGATVTVRVNWPRRHDHMQQHSGQHLVTAVFERDYGIDTSAWHMGQDTSYVQLSTPQLTAAQLVDAERTMNAIIAKGCAVSVLQVDAGASALGNGDDDDDNNTDQRVLVTRATRGLPADHVGAVRIVTFAGIESNMCCGTHVRNLSQLQAVRLLYTEQGKQIGGRPTVLLHFQVGARVLRESRVAFERERRLNVVLGCEPAAHAEMVQKLQEKLRSVQKSVKRLHKEMAALEAQRVDAIEANGGFYFVNRTDGQDTSYLQALLAAIKRKNVLVVATSGEENSGRDGAAGKLMMQGRAEDVDALASGVCELLEGKGAGKNGRFQAKVGSLKRLKECEALVTEYFGKMKLVGNGE